MEHHIDVIYQQLAVGLVEAEARKRNIAGDCGNFGLEVGHFGLETQEKLRDREVMEVLVRVVNSCLMKKEKKSIKKINYRNRS